MKDGVCPKCSDTQIYHSYSKKYLECGLHAHEGQLHIYVHEDKGFLGTHSSLYLDCYLCRGCGYFENYVHDLQELERLDSSVNWRPVNPVPSS
jgi:hypothetical protein